ncbi:MAG TPA: erythromycin esterase family protein [Chitinophaga sp.]|uniref:erythromycin esterase family protein n=1 Tax=Chitinophaga sp. TaxID=1869181 RepID=UPI002C013B20|nr:erythromycin esterase family protein [Chitinophaga sp.]HVI45106.1 erythromycin esterase family protein [Chitinophaga sp.]
MRKTILIVLLLSCLFAEAQQGEDACMQRTAIDTAGNGALKFADDNRIRSILTGNKILLLGDQTHREGTVTTMKIRLIRYLHEQLGYNVLLFEDDFFSLYQLNKQMTDGNFSRADDAFGPILADNEEFTGLLDYLRETYRKGSPLQVYGFDAQIFNDNNEALVTALASYMRSRGTTLTSADQDFLRSQFSEVMGFPHEGEPLKNAAEKERFDALLKTVKDALAKHPEERDAYFWKQIVYIIQETFAMVGRERSGHQEPVQNFRDRLMAANFASLSDHLAKEKLIGWGAAYHFAARLSKYEKSEVTDKYVADMQQQQSGKNDAFSYSILDEAVTMGSILKKQYGSRLYALAFTTAEGTYGLPGGQPLRVLPPPAGSLEYRLKQSGSQAAWIHLAGNKQCAPFLALPLGHLPLLADWPQIFNGMLYLPEVTPLTVRTQHQSRSSQPVNNTVKLHGNVVDAVSGKGVGFANIFVRNSRGNGCVTNESGKFELILQRGSPADTLQISALGYKMHFSKVKADTGAILITLEPVAIRLNEIVVTAEAPMRTDKLMKQVRQRLGDNYPSGSTNLEMFFRGKFYKSGQLLNKKEVVADFLFTEGYSQTYSTLRSYNNTHLVRIKQVRNFLSQKPMSMPYLNMMYFDIVSGTMPLLQSGKASRYDFKIDGISVYNDDTVYIVSFHDNRTQASLAYDYISSYTGKLYISRKDFGILKYESNLQRKLPQQNNDTLTYDFHISATYEKQGGVYNLKTGRISHVTGPKEGAEERIYEFLTTGVNNGQDEKNFLKLMDVPVNDPPFDAAFWQQYNIVADD